MSCVQSVNLRQLCCIRVTATASKCSLDKYASFMDSLRTKDRKNHKPAEGSVKESKAFVQAMRNAMPSTQKFCTLCSLSADLHKNIVLINFTSHPARHVFGLIDKYQRGPSANLQFHCDVARGCGCVWDAVADLCNPYSLSRFRQLVSINLRLSEADVPLHLCHHRGELLNQRVLTSELWNLSLQQVVCWRTAHISSLCAPTVVSARLAYSTLVFNAMVTSVPPSLISECVLAVRA